MLLPSDSTVTSVSRRKPAAFKVAAAAKSGSSWLRIRTRTSSLLVPWFKRSASDRPISEETTTTRGLGVAMIDSRSTLREADVSARRIHGMAERISTRPRRVSSRGSTTITLTGGPSCLSRTDARLALHIAPPCSCETKNRTLLSEGLEDRLRRLKSKIYNFLGCGIVLVVRHKAEATYKDVRTPRCCAYKRQPRVNPVADVRRGGPADNQAGGLFSLRIVEQRVTRRGAITRYDVSSV